MFVVCLFVLLFVCLFVVCLSLVAWVTETYDLITQIVIPGCHWLASF